MSAGAEHPEGTVYMLHFDQPYRHARHYTGWAADLAERLAEHAAGRGARLTQVVRDAGISWQLARTWPGTRATERDIKDRRNAPAMCPACSQHPWPGTGHRKQAEDLAARRDAAAFLAGVRSAESWAAPVIATGRLDEARQMLGLDYHPADRQDAERQRGFTAQLAAMIRTADAGPGQARETEQAAQEKENATMRNPLTARREDREYERQEMARVEENMRDVEAGQAEQDRLEAEASEQAPVQWALPAELALERSLTRDDAQSATGPDEARQLYPQATEFTAEGLAREASDDPDLTWDADGNPSADSDADAAQYEHDPGSWLARDGDGQVLEVDADGHPGREASPDDGRPVAEPEEPAGWQAEAESAAWGGREPSRSYAEWAAEGHQLEAEAG